ncbi:MAG: hypothetical protein IRY99_10620 [Isosphaeraceae bacterium]|nr:hypothetical protein [Isosphaeraceae bacterium]
MQALARHGFAVEVLCGARFDLDQEIDLAAWLAERGHAFEMVQGTSWTADARGVRSDIPPHFRLEVRGVPITLHHSPTTRPHQPEGSEHEQFLALFHATLDRFRPEILVTYGGSRLARAVLAHARAQGLATVFNLHNLQYHRLEPFRDVDVVRVPSHFAAEHYRQTLGLRCRVLSNLVDAERVRVERPEPRYVTFVNPSAEKGVYVFARIADELGRRRPEIPLLVVEGRGTEATLAACGLDLRVHGNVFLMAHTPDPRRFWRVSRLCLMPSLCGESQGRVAIEAMLNP